MTETRPTTRSDADEPLHPTRRGLLRAGAATAAAATAGMLSAPVATAATPDTGQRTVIRTPDTRFRSLPDYPFAPRYAMIDVGAGTKARVHYVDERPADPGSASGETVVLIHGNPSWSYLYRHVIPPLVAAGHRCVAVDLVGFGKSDKLTDRFAYTYANHVEWLRQVLFDHLSLRNVTMVGHDWGGMVGLLLLAEHPQRFRRVVASNTGLRRGGADLGPGWEHVAKWLQFTQRTEKFDAGEVVETYTSRVLDRQIKDAYNAPFPGDAYLHGARRWAVLIPITDDDEANWAIDRAWEVLGSLTVPFLCVFGAEDHVTRGNHSGLSDHIPGAQGQPHIAVPGAAHFLQEDRPAEFTEAIATFIRSTPSPP